MKKILLIDANALLHRAYHALPELTDSEGEPINAVYGFFLAFLKVLKDTKPDYVCAAFDLPEPTFRHKRFEGYKAQRPETPDKLVVQVPRTKEFLKVFGVPVYEKAGFEADDILATVAERVASEEKGMEAVIVTGDLDLLQVVDENTKVYGLRRGVKDIVLYDEEKVKERYGFSPDLLDDYRGLKGDSSDNIPGIKGIGRKTASRLLKKFGDIERIYKEAEKSDSNIGEGVRKKLLSQKEKAVLSKELATIKKDVPFDFKLEACSWENYDKEKVERTFREAGFKTLIDRLPGNRREQKILF